MNKEKNLIAWLKRNGFKFEEYNDEGLKGVCVHLENITLEVATEGGNLVLIESPEDCGKQYNNKELYRRIKELSKNN